MHFEEEELSPTTWPVPWLRHLLAAHLPSPTVARLVRRAQKFIHILFVLLTIAKTQWDVYFSCDEGLLLHGFVCLALVSFVVITSPSCIDASKLVMGYEGAIARARRR